MGLIFTKSEGLAELVGHYNGSEVAFVRLDLDCRSAILVTHTTNYLKLLYKLGLNVFPVPVFGDGGQCLF